MTGERPSDCVQTRPGASNKSSKYGYYRGDAARSRVSTRFADSPFL
jgi:hypothetical protein